MGMYTEFHFNAQLKKDTPKSIINILKDMIYGDREYEEIKTPDHPLFTNSQRWYGMLTCDSYYFAADTISTLRFDDTAERYFLCIRCNLKNYDNEIENFVDWIDPYIEAKSENFLGFSRFESRQEPSIIRKK
jgi:hypothetical protein